MKLRLRKPSRPWPLAIALLSIVMAVLALFNLCLTMTPHADLNARIVDDLGRAPQLMSDDRVKLLHKLLKDQEYALGGKPSEPFAWARLAYLRLATGQDARNAFAALQMSDLVSPDEPRQLPERALMWRQMRGVEDDTAKAYQAELWEKSFRIQPDITWQLAAKNGISAEVGQALARDPDLQEEWKARAPESSTP